MLWTLIGLMAVLAAVIAAKPLFGSRGTAATVAVFVAGSSLALYALIGRPDLSLEQAPPTPDQMVASLAERLQEDPSDLQGWKMLGRSYMVMENYRGAVDAFRRAVDLESASNAQTLVDLGESMLAASGQQRLSQEVVAVFESALALEASNPSALFWAGIAAANRGDIEVAASRWERLLSTQPPEQIRVIIEQRIAEWRGTEAVPPSAPDGITVNISLADVVPDEIPAGTPVFIIARDPAQPSPPVAVTRRQFSEIPTSVQLTDRDSMIPGRALSAFDEIEIVVRLSMSGQPAAQSGDWYASSVIKGESEVDLRIEQQLP